MHEVNMHIQGSQQRCSSVRLQINTLKTGTQASPVSRTVVTSKLPLLREIKEKKNELIREKRYVTAMTMATDTETGDNVIHEMGDFGYNKVCTQCFPHLQMEEHKHQQKMFSYNWGNSMLSKAMIFIIAL
jgi:hypothetical protein